MLYWLYKQEEMFTKKDKTEENPLFGAIGAIFTSILLTPVLSKAEDFLYNALAQVKETTNEYFKELSQALVLLAAAFAGVIFILVGISAFLNDLYQRPGIGQLIVGAAILLVTLVWYVMPSHKK
jgi:hypothetical protein